MFALGKEVLETDVEVTANAEIVEMGWLGLVRRRAPYIPFSTDTLSDTGAPGQQSWHIFIVGVIIRIVVNSGRRAEVSQREGKNIVQRRIKSSDGTVFGSVADAVVNVSDGQQGIERVGISIRHTSIVVSILLASSSKPGTTYVFPNTAPWVVGDTTVVELDATIVVNKRVILNRVEITAVGLRDGTTGKRKNIITQ